MLKKSLFPIVLFILFLTGCQQEQEPDVFSPARAWIEPLEYADGTKAAMNGSSLSWESGDAYGLWNGTELYTYTYDSNNTFRPNKAVKKSSSYSVYYPVSAIKTANYSSFTVTVPETQVNKNGSFSQGAFPFICTTTELSTVNFKNIMGVLDLKLKTSTMTKKITSVKVTSDKAIAGTATISADDCSIAFSNSKYEVNISTDVTASPETAAEFMVVLPPATHKLTVTVTAEDGSTLELKYKSVNVERSKIIVQNAVKDFSDSSQPVSKDEKIIILNEGNWQSDNGQLSYIYNHNITNGWFKSVNGTKVGDTPQDIIQLRDDLLAISVNWSNIVYFIRPDGRIVAQTENVPNCRYMATDGNNLYITSYAHETALGEIYTKGYVAKISLTDYKVKATCEVGYEPEGICCYGGKLYIANTGGYAFSEDHDYENTVSVVDCATMKKLRDVEIVNGSGQKVINLYGTMSHCGRFLCINSPGDYYNIPPQTVIFNMENDSYTVYDFPSTYNTYAKDDKFFTIGSAFSYLTYEYTYYIKTIDLLTGEVYDGYICPDGSVSSEVTAAIESMQNPYCTYQNPYSGHLYITDAASYASAGKVYEFDEKGRAVGTPLKCYINPGHMIALP